MQFSRKHFDENKVFIPFIKIQEDVFMRHRKDAVINIDSFNRISGLETACFLCLINASSSY